MDTKGQRSSKPDMDETKEKSHDAQVEKEVKKLLEEKDLFGVNADRSALERKLREKIGDHDVIRAIMKRFAKELKKVNKVAEEALEKFVKKYAGEVNENKLRHFLAKYKKKKDWNDSMYEAFIQALKYRMEGFKNDLGKIEKYSAFYGILGKPETVVYTSTEKAKMTAEQGKIADEIVKLYEKTLNSYQQSLLSSLYYTDVSPTVVTAKYNKEFHEVSDGANTLIAFLFLPKIQAIDKRFLWANIGNVIRCRRQGKALKSLPDVELLNDLITNEDSMACELDNPMGDLLKRFKVQIELFETIPRFRQGKIYDKKNIKFTESLNTCRSGFFDSPDNSFVTDPASYLRRLFNALAFVPTKINTLDTPNSSFASLLTYQDGFYQNAPKQFNVPMITFRLPPTSLTDQKSYDLMDSMSQQQMFYDRHHGGSIKSKSVHSSNGVLVFYVRRLTNMDMLRDNPVLNSFTQLPLTAGGTNELNETPVNFKFDIVVGGEKYVLRSVLTFEKHTFDDSYLVTGTAAQVVKYGSSGEAPSFFRYDPIAPSTTYDAQDGSGTVTPTPFTYLLQHPNPSYPGADSFYESASRRGVLFMYEKYVDSEM